MHRIVKWVAPLLLSFAVWLPAAQGQTTVPRAGANAEAEREDRVPAFQYTLALLFTMLVLVIVCMPTRKAAHE